MRFLLHAGTSLLLLGSALVGSTAHADTAVDGDHFSRSGIRIASQGCLNPGESPTTAPQVTIRRGPDPLPAGDHSVGWTGLESGFGIGPMVQVARPSALVTLSIAVNAPETQAAGAAVVSFVQPGRAGVWKGWSLLEPATSGGWRTLNAATSSYQWRHFTDGVADEDAGNATIESFVNGHGGDGEGARVGFIFGCDGRPFFLDQLTVDTGDAKQVYDFEGYQTRTSMLLDGKARRLTTIIAGAKVPADLRLRKLFDNAPKSGKLVVRARGVNDSSFRKFATRRLGKTGNASVALTPSRTTVYRVDYAGEGVYDGSSSQVLKVRVRYNVVSRLSDKTVRPGSKVAISGTVYPREKAALKIQRWVGKRWKSVRSARTNGRGDYRVQLKAPKPGVSFWRVRATGGKANVAGWSPALRLRSVKPSGGGGGGGGTPTPPPPPPPTEPPPPPPPPPGPQRLW
ncbi:hypothetical protein [Nocardioides ferulae]|uniref:hypothetical protein n=1 Tax=Nocardioides ferulae TaxID=2340821 RepID=UPI000EB094B6|nr:hypothetical protein [Nocardioides ferulae]